MIDLDDVDFVGEQQALPIVPMSAMNGYQRRFARDAEDEGDAPSPFRPPLVQKRADAPIYTPAGAPEPVGIP